MWRDVHPVFESFLDAPYAYDEDAPVVPEDYRKWARVQSNSMKRANRDGVFLTVLDFILTHPEFPLMEFLEYTEDAGFTEAQWRTVLEIARHEVFPDAPPAPVPLVAELDPSGLLDKTPSVTSFGSETPA